MPAAVLIANFCLFALLVPGYLTSANVTQLMVDDAEPAIIASAMAVALIGGGIDLSLGVTFALCDLTALVLFRVEGFPLPVAVVATLCVGAAIGLVNGILIATLELQPFLTTLATMLVLRGVYQLSSQAYAVRLADASNDSPAWQALGTARLLGVPINLLAALLIALAGHVLLTRTRYGAHVVAMGSNALAARHAGLRSMRLELSTYLLSSTMAAIAGLFYAARQDTASSNLGAGWEVAGLAAAVIGGVGLSGGRGTIVNAAIGAGIISLLAGGLLRMNAPGSASSAVLGGVLLIGVGMSRGAASIFGPGPTAANKAAAVHAHPQARSTMCRAASLNAGREHPAIAVIDATKTFDGVRALDHVDFDVGAGEIHALVGANGAGKSTLMRVLAGDAGLTAGTVKVGGRDVVFKSPADALAMGIAMVYQETSLVPDISVARNLVLGREPAIIVEREIEAAARDLLAEWGSGIDPRVPADRLGTAQRQIVEIARAVARRTRILILDEPTASLTPHERQVLFANIRSARDRGLAIILVTHVLEEALDVTDRITVLRNGRVVETLRAVTADENLLVNLMMGPEGSTTPPVSSERSRPSLGTPLLQVAGLSVGGTVRDVDFTLHEREILGLSGLRGSGRTDIARAIAGIHTRGVKGSISLRGSTVRSKTPARAIRNGVIYITGDRQREGLFGSLTAEANIALGVRAVGRAVARFGFGRRTALRAAADWMKRFSVKPLGRGAKARHYSGGNQQKVVLARGLAQGPDIVIVDEPTRGVDVGAIGAIHAAIGSIADEGKGVILISSDLREIESLCDRVIVLSKGRVSNILTADTLTESSLTEAILA